MHSRNLAGCLLAAALLCVLPAVGRASATFERMLQEADKVRSADSKRFGTLLKALDSDIAQADPLQRQRLRYLHAYALVTYGDKSALGVEQAKTLFNQASDIDLKFRAGSLVANSCGITRNFGEGLRYLDLTMPLRHKVQDKDIRHDGINTAAVLYDQLGQYGLSRQYAEETLSGDPNPRARCFAGHLRLKALYGLGSLPHDDAPIQGVVEQCVTQGETIVANSVRATLARKWAAQGQYDKAIALLQRHLAEVEDTRFPRLIGDVRSLLAELLLAKGDLAGAERDAKAAIAQSASLTNPQPLVSAYKTRYEIDVRRRDLAGALAHYRSYAEADKAFLNDVKAREQAYQIVRQETQQKNQKIELLEKQNQLLQLQQRVERQGANNTRLLALLLALLVAGIGYWAYKIKRVHVSLRRFAETDALTGICNRHHFTLQAEKSIARCAKAGEPVALVMFDLDHFKAINDSYGHVTGDWVLQRVADTCRNFCREIDHVGRLGGEEFAILLHGCDLEAATRLAEDCRLRLTQIETRESGHAFSVTASFGVSAASLSGYDLAKLLSHADQMLYRAKRDGRNCVRGYAIDMSFASQTDASSPLEETSPARGGPLRSHQGLRSLGS